MSIIPRDCLNLISCDFCGAVYDHGTLLRRFPDLVDKLDEADRISFKCTACGRINKAKYFDNRFEISYEDLKEIIKCSDEYVKEQKSKEKKDFRVKSVEYKPLKKIKKRKGMMVIDYEKVNAVDLERFTMEELNYLKLRIEAWVDNHTGEEIEK